MLIGIITNNDYFMPLSYTLATQQQQVHVFYCPSPDALVNQKVSAFVNEGNLPFTEEKNADTVYQWLQQGHYDACFILGYNKLIDLSRLKNCPTQLFNIHFGPLPAFKGAVPVFWQLRYGVDKIGVAIHRLSQKFDDGPIVWYKDMANLPHYSYQLANQALSNLCVEGVFYILQLIMQKMPVPQIDAGNNVPSYQKRPGLNDVLINWQQMYAAEICNMIRACNPWNKGALSVYKGVGVNLVDAVIVNNNYEIKLAPGTIVNDEQCLHIYCLGGAVINTNMLFFNDSFVPAYQCREWGFIRGGQFGQAPV